MGNLKLWVAPGACSFGPHIVIREVNANFELVVINVREGFPEKYAYLNPKKRVPILELDENIITELPAIMTAIAQMAPEKHLLGKTNLEVIRTYEYLNWLSGTLHAQGFGCVWRPARFSKDEKTYDAIKTKGRETIDEGFGIIESKLDGLHAVGDAFTVIDAFLLVFYRWGYRVGIEMAEKYPKFSALAQDVAKRDSAQVAAKEEGIDVLKG